MPERGAAESGRIVDRHPLSLAGLVEGHENNGRFHHLIEGNIITLFNSLATTFRNISIAVGTVAFMWGALIYATAGGSPRQMEQGKAAMVASVVGVGAVVLATAIVTIVRNALSGGAGG